MSNIKIVPADESHFDQIWEIFHEVVKEGDSYVYDPKTTKEQAHSIWMNDSIDTYVAITSDNKVAGTYIMKPNFPGLGSHVANCSYMVNSEFRGQGIGKSMGEHSIYVAKEKGYLAIQFNIVVSTNIAAIRLWQSLGLDIVGTVPHAFNHSTLGLVDVYIMYRRV
jgi:L-amino acid N-acyltransferase YncA